MKRPKTDKNSRSDSAQNTPTAQTLDQEIRQADPGPPLNDLYAANDYQLLLQMSDGKAGVSHSMRSLDELLERDKVREKDGFPRKIKLGKLVKPTRDSGKKVIVVPTTVEEKFVHDSRFKQKSEGGEQSGGQGEGDEGEVIGEQPVHESQEGEGAGAGQGEGGSHEIDADAYDLGRVLTEQFQLPNLKEKGKRRSLTRFTYDLTDRNRGFGQILDKKATLRQVLETNIGLGKIADPTAIDPGDFLIAPGDKVYRILSREKDFESQAVVFFIRDYSGSMYGNPTELVVTQHILIYSWLLYQYHGRVELRFILHDTQAREVDDFYTYYNSRVAGGTQVAAGYRLINKIVAEESLSSESNIYVFHGTDGDDWDREGTQAIKELEIMLNYASRVGITIAERAHVTPGTTLMENYLKRSGMIERSKTFRVDSMKDNVGEARIIEGIKNLVSE